MNYLKLTLRYAITPLAVCGAGIASYYKLTPQDWSNISSGLFVGFSIFAGAILTRMARTAPFSNPDVFTDQNVVQYFFALREVSVRLSVILFLIFFDIFILMLCIFSSKSGNLTFYTKILSFLMGSITSLVVFRVVDLVKGDFGFLELQKNIILTARRQKVQQKQETEEDAQVDEWTSEDKYGDSV